MSEIFVLNTSRATYPIRLRDLLPPDTRVGVSDLSSRVQGFSLAEYESSPSALPLTQFTTHLVGVALKGQTSCSLSWRQHGVATRRAFGEASMFSMSPGEMDGLSWDGALRMLTLSIEPSQMDLVVPETSRARSVELRTIRAGVPDAVLGHLLESIRQEARGGYLGGRLFIESLCHTTALYIAERYGVASHVVKTRPSGLDRRVLARVLEFIEAHVSTELSVSILAGVACQSYYHFGRQFRASTGTSVHRYVMQRRVARARTLLKSSDLSLSEIAVCAGFYDQSHLTHIFKRDIGITPRSYRKNVR